jgi:pilus assembly protein CpaC
MDLLFQRGKLPCRGSRKGALATLSAFQAERNMRKPLAILCLAALLLGSAGPILGQTVPVAPAAQAPSVIPAPQPAPMAQTAPRLVPVGPRVVSGRSVAGPVRVLEARNAGEIRVALNKSQVLELDQPYAEVSVGNPAVADVVPISTRSVYVFGKQPGTTNLTLTGQGGRVIAVVDLVVSQDVESLRERLAELMPNEPIEVRPASDGVVLSGTVSSPDRLTQALAVASRYAPEKVTNLLKVAGTQQVMLAVRFAEVQRSVVKQLGVSNLIQYDGGTVDFALQSGDGRSVDPLSFAAAALGISSGDFRLNTLIDALEERGVVKVLAEPNLIALSGGTAKFLAGGEFPIPVDQDDDGITVEFKEFGVGLSFTPTVLGSDLVNLELFTEVSAIDPSVSIRISQLDIPGLRTRRAKTTVELKNGQSFAIAGLLSDDFRDSVRALPGLGNLPVLGQLFRSNGFRSEQTELVVVVTPYMVQPQAVANLKLPTDSFVPPSTGDLFLFGRTEGVLPQWRQGNAGALPSGGLSGQHGYILQ